MRSLSSQLHLDHSSTDLSILLNCLAVACKDIASRLQQGAMAGVLGSAGEENVQGETQKKLDVIANDILKDYLQDSGVVRALASEEEEDIVECSKLGNYLVSFDPLDGSSNIDINSMVGTIFSIYETTAGGDISSQDFLQPGRNQVAAGYVLYGPSVMLVLTTGNGVKMYTLDQRIGEFMLTQEQVSIAADTKEFAINMSNQRHWAEPMQRYIGDLLAGQDGPRGKNFNMRWVAAMVADVHRILCRGGLFTYPWDQREPEKPGKLRLMYEANPMGMLIEQAGGKAYTDQGPILDIQPSHIHQRVPVILGAANEVDACLGYHLAP
ncbi:class 1 fructose-bisphosphatase [Dasania sp. GY-MA-18]|uniref:Fructose-1,6-bisphosphatase class 1 n=1 Tax=Dasania phycosphaerae TaxID=2950436 RepID=A0A9J6RJY3_9GAMM|nr:MULTISPECIES: class 1 fructose-bisphosphatase [Dasania]MCR8922286.1 class 1 fructose-bisphosphatase [Dasania sp. GY-MA-18]MCZ0864714.1 class 1 fructose-bisphosphatase [Dasania phycosphaerae]MCZ0868442.1 class 1 fructose-bisphosphatase [Dasania phycosphaerae]